MIERGKYDGEFPYQIHSMLKRERSETIGSYSLEKKICDNLFSSKKGTLFVVLLIIYSSLCVRRSIVFLHNNGGETFTKIHKSTNEFYQSLNNDPVSETNKFQMKAKKENIFTDVERNTMNNYKSKFGCKITKKEARHSKATIDAQNHCVHASISLSSSPSMRHYVDVLSLGYKDRLEYMETQLESWASHNVVRSFWGLTELDDKQRNCEENIKDIGYHVDRCQVRHERNREGMKKFRTSFYDMKYLSKKKNPGKWICAQSRLILGLGKLAKEYKRKIKTHSKEKVLPDYLVMVEDDAYMNMEHFEDFVKSKDSSIPIAYSGCPTNLILQLGGFNLILSKGILERLIRPLSCFMDPKPNAVPKWEKSVCDTLEKSLLGEYDIFYHGMSLTDIIYELASKSNFCMFAGWFMKYLISEFSLSQPTQDTGKVIHPYYSEAENCAANGDLGCKSSSKVCFWQTPEAMASKASSAFAEILK